jgi:hypothetical protein
MEGIMKKLILLCGIALTCVALSGCVVVPARPVAYTPVYYVGGGYHAAWR